MADPRDEDELLREVALQNAQAIALARQRAEAELERTQQELRAAQQRLQIVTDSLPVAVAWIGRDLRYRFANPAFSRWVRRPLPEIVGHRIDEVLDPNLVSKMQPHIERVLAGQQVEYERIADLPGVGERWIRVVFSPTHAATAAAGGAELIDGWLAVGSDVHDSRIASQRLKEADRRKDEFLATLAHELRNPLAPIRSAVELMKMSPDDAALSQKARDIIERQVVQMVRLVDDLLDVSRITTGKLALRRTPADVAAIARAALEAVAPFASEREHVLHTRLPEQPLYVEADATRLTQVFLNLLHNAVKFTEPGGRIDFELGMEGAELVVRVRDSGIGIPPDQLESIFEMFNQGDQSLERPSSGLGVGLALTRQLVQLHGGRVTARSRGRRMGSEFEVRLPNARAGKAAATMRPARAAATPRRILLVDDNRDFAESLATMLRALGNEVRVVHDGAAGGEAAREFRPDVAFLDIGMPKVNGYDLARRLRDTPDTARSVLVALTGYSQPADRERATQAGFDGYLVKPVDLERVREILARLPAS